MRELKDIEKIYKSAQNQYEAVLIASKRARILNQKRLRELEQGVEGSAGMHRVAETALDELIEGKIEVSR